MNKKSLLSLCLFAASTVLSFITIHIMSLFDISEWVGVSVGLSLFVVMAILLLAASSKKKIKKRVKALRYVVLTVNAIADGLAISSLFTYLGYFPEIWQTAAVAVGLIALFALYLAVTYIPFARNHYKISMLIYALIILGLCIAWCVTASQATKAASFLTILQLIIFIAFFITLATGAYNAEEHIKNITYASFAGIVVAIIVLAIISDGGDLPIDGIGGVDSASAKKKRNPYSYIATTHAATNSLIHVNSKKRSKQENEPLENLEPTDDTEQ